MSPLQRSLFCSTFVFLIVQDELSMAFSLLNPNKSFKFTPTKPSLLKNALPISDYCLTPTIRVVPNDKLFVSEPEPWMFGNGPNPANDTEWTEKNWLKSRFHFSFAEYINYGNTNFGALRVMNDDTVQPHRGFGTHPHRDAEIITYVVNGELTHKDSMGTQESLGRGSIQFMTAGTGIRHSEYNLGDKVSRFIQSWVIPAERGLEPRYGSYEGSFEDRYNQLFHLISNVKDPSTDTPVQINQVMDGYVAELDLGKSVSIDLPVGKQAYLLCIEGGVDVNGNELNKFDAAEITESGLVTITASATESTVNGDHAHILMFVMDAVQEPNRSDF